MCPNKNDEVMDCHWSSITVSSIYFWAHKDYGSNGTRVLSMVSNQEGNNVECNKGTGNMVIILRYGNTMVLLICKYILRTGIVTQPTEYKVREHV